MGVMIGFVIGYGSHAQACRDRRLKEEWHPRTSDEAANLVAQGWRWRRAGAAGPTMLRDSLQAKPSGERPPPCGRAAERRRLTMPSSRVPRSVGAAGSSRTSPSCRNDPQVMEVCGGHTQTIYRHGIEHVLTEGVEIVHVRRPARHTMGRVDDAIAIRGPLG